MPAIMILDDHPLVRQGIRMVLSMEQQFDIAGEASNAEDALALMDKVRPDIALVDLNLGKDKGLDFIQRARQLGHGSKFLILTSSATGSELKLAQSLGVEGMCLKEAMPEDLLYAVEVVARGRKYYDPVFMDTLLADSAARAHSGGLDELTPKELEVLIELGKGRPNKEIASELFITEFTVKKHVSQILAKLNLADRTQAALFAMSKGLVQYESIQ
ncbi:response regulator [Paenibacillus sp. strain BS8-2]